jgi:hypothetical protein
MMKYVIPMAVALLMAAGATTWARNVVTQVPGSLATPACIIIWGATPVIVETPSIVYC